MDNGATVTHAEGNDQAMAVLRGGKGADLLLVEDKLGVTMTEILKAERS